MPDLIAQGSANGQRWRRTLPEGQKMVLGRRQGSWGVPWDDRISRRHVQLCWKDGQLAVVRLPEARNPVFIQGQPVESFFLRPGEHFVIGSTMFRLVDEQVNVTSDAPLPMTERAYSSGYLHGLRFRDAAQRIDVLSRLPELISSAGSDEDLFVRLVNVLLTGVRRASAAAVVAVRDTNREHSRVEILHWDRSLDTGAQFAPSERLIRQALERRESVVHVWTGSQSGGAAFTQCGSFDWALCTPLQGEACRGWAVYLTGSFAPPESAAEPDALEPPELQDDLKFTEIAATTVSALRDQRNHAGLRQFFSPVVLDALAGQDPNVVLAPREADVSVLFCDLRGFSRTSEQGSNDLPGLLHRVSKALGVMTHHILEQGGVVGDFHGDAAMGFWGWPMEQPDAVLRACRAALGIRAEFAEAAQCEDHPLADFRMGIGIATGRAVAGKIGTVDQVKVTVFGPVVNLAARLEDMTKVMRAPILLDDRSASVIRREVPRDVARVRRVAIVRPPGLQATVEISELLPPERDSPQLTDEHIAAYEAALEALIDRDWTRAFRLLHEVPAEDRVKDFLTVFIAQHNRTPPENWDGVIPVPSTQGV